MKVLRCRDIGERTCDFNAEGNSTEEVERELLDHTAQKHWWVLESFDKDEREHFFEQMDAMIEEKKST
jgi:predicted small metal-binding protein